MRKDKTIYTCDRCGDTAEGVPYDYTFVQDWVTLMRGCDILGHLCPQCFKRAMDKRGVKGE